MKIGVISDTHDFLDPKVLNLLRGVDHILHAGDIGMPWLLMELETVAPVTAVAGNTDDAHCRFKQTQCIELGGRKFLIHHIVNPRALDDNLKKRITKEQPHVVVFGHTHKAFCETIGGVLYFNPGYAGRPKFNTDRCVAILDCDQDGVRHEFLPL
ncbi:MAG TPA: metallophosphoesterase family protein [Verrucomicrobiota bacterium]|nr:metallophosphoesterase family protein [Verrucomicrobiota bacterium]